MAVLIRVLMEDDKEILFNADCQVALLLDAIKKAHDIPKSEVIDLCSTEGVMKELYKRGRANAAAFFKMRELCIVISIQNPYTEPHFIPLLKEYADNKCLETLLNTKDEHPSGPPKNKFRHTASHSLPRTSGTGRIITSAKVKPRSSRRFTQYH